MNLTECTVRAPYLRWRAGSPQVHLTTPDRDQRPCALTSCVCMFVQHTAHSLMPGACYPIGSHRTARAKVRMSRNNHPYLGNFPPRHRVAPCCSTDYRTASPGKITMPASLPLSHANGVASVKYAYCTEPLAPTTKPAPLSTASHETTVLCSGFIN